jgi:acetyl-CoA acetyltransferase
MVLLARAIWIRSNAAKANQGKAPEEFDMRDVYVIGAYATVFKKHPGLSFGDLAREAYMGALADAGKNDGTDIETGWLGNCGMGFWGQNSIRAQALFQPLVEEGLFPERVPMFNVENACATASTAFMGAWKDVLAGTHELSFCIGIENLFSPDAPERTASLFNHRKRPMSLSVIRKLTKAWDIPTDILVQPYRLEGERSPRAA